MFKDKYPVRTRLQCAVDELSVKITKLNKDLASPSDLPDTAENMLTQKAAHKCPKTDKKINAQLVTEDVGNNSTVHQ